MSVVEFTVAMPIALLALVTSHEVIRIVSIERAADLLVHSAASTATLTSLSHISRGTFENDGRVESEFESKLKESALIGLKDPLLHWSFFSNWRPEENTSIIGIRTYARGPTKKRPFNAIHISTNICVSSWLETFFTRIVQSRNCLGQFTASKNTSGGQASGIMVSVSAERSIPFWIPTYFLGYRND